MSTRPPEVHRLEAELAKRMGKRAYTAKELAAELVADEAPADLISALDDALAWVAAEDESDDLDATLWGPEPTAEQLARARRVAQRAQQDELAIVLADALTREQVARLLGVSAQAVSKRHAAGTLSALARGRELRFPAWQFHEGAALPGLAELLAAYPGGALALSTWASTPNPDLDGLTPAQALARRDGVERVLAAIESISAAAW
jgi:hypothetical protein